MWKNCLLYNKTGDFVERIGNRASLSFENLWAMSGYADDSQQQTGTPGLGQAKSDPISNAATAEKPLKPRDTKLETMQKAKVWTVMEYKEYQWTSFSLHHRTRVDPLIELHG